MLVLGADWQWIKEEGALLFSVDGAPFDQQLVVAARHNAPAVRRESASLDRLEMAAERSHL